MSARISARKAQAAAEAQRVRIEEAWIDQAIEENEHENGRNMEYTHDMEDHDMAPSSNNNKRKRAASSKKKKKKESDTDDDLIEDEPFMEEMIGGGDGSGGGGGGEEHEMDGGQDEADDAPPTKKRKGVVLGKTAERATTGGGDYKGLRHFSILVCEKLQALGTSTYKEIADQLVNEAKAQAKHDAAAAMMNNQAPFEVEEELTVKGKKKKKERGVEEDEKNIRRRIYDALNVLMAMDIITKDKKNIRWRGFEAMGISPSLGGGVNGTGAGASAALPVQQQQPNHQPQAMNKTIASLKAQLKLKKAALPEKRAQLDELVLQYCGVRSLIQRNARHSTTIHAAIAHASSSAGHAALPVASPSASSSAAAASASAASSSSSSSSPHLSEEQKVHWPFLILAAPPGIPVECTTDEPRQMAILNFAEPFVVHEHTRILQYTGASWIRNTQLPSVEHAAQQIAERSRVSFQPASSVQTSVQAPVSTSTTSTSSAAAMVAASQADSPFDSLVSAAAASPKLKPVTSRHKMASAAAKKEGIIAVTPASDPLDPRVHLPQRLWSFLPASSILAPSAAVFSAAHSVPPQAMATVVSHRFTPAVTALYPNANGVKVKREHQSPAHSPMPLQLSDSVGSEPKIKQEPVSLQDDS